MSGPLTVGIVCAVAVLAWPGRPPAQARLARAMARTVASTVGRNRRRPPAVGRPRWRTVAERVSARWPRPSARADRAAGMDRAVLVLLEGLAGALRAGLTPAQALSHLATAVDVDRPDPLARLPARLAAQASAGARLEPLLRAEASHLDSPALLAAAAGWAMAERYGAPVVDVLDGMVAALRDAARTAAAVQTALAAPRATASLLAVLPLGGVLLGEVVGVDPLAVLLGTPIGRADLGLGLLATWCGRVWMRHLVRGVERG